MPKELWFFLFTKTTREVSQSTSPSAHANWGVKRETSNCCRWKDVFPKFLYSLGLYTGPVQTWVFRFGWYRIGCTDWFGTRIGRKSELRLIYQEGRESKVKSFTGCCQKPSMVYMTSAVNWFELCESPNLVPFPNTSEFPCHLRSWPELKLCFLLYNAWPVT